MILLIVSTGELVAEFGYLLDPLLRERVEDGEVERRNEVRRFEKEVVIDGKAGVRILIAGRDIALIVDDSGTFR
jgi:hypothetical protein